MPLPGMSSAAMPSGPGGAGASRQPALIQGVGAAAGLTTRPTTARWLAPPPPLPQLGLETTASPPEAPGTGPSAAVASAAEVSSGGELQSWLVLLDPSLRQLLRHWLNLPLVQERSFARQLLDSWAGQQLLRQLGGLLTTSRGQPTTRLLQESVTRLLGRGQVVTPLALLVDLPPQRLRLNLDGATAMASQWRRQVALQQHALERLQRLSLPTARVKPLAFSDPIGVQPLRRTLRVAHRNEPLPLEIWPAAPGRGQSRPPWLLLMPGLGGTADQLGWLAGDLAGRGWPAVVLQHPGSDAVAVKAALDGDRPPPGAETLAARLADAQAVLVAQRRGELPVQGQGVVLIGHSLGGLTALLLAGLPPEPGLARRCEQPLQGLPLTNPSRLLQCQLASIGVPTPAAPPPDLRGVVVFNGFGSQLWPERGVAPLMLPLLLVGGSLDVVTPPVQEQLRLFQGPADPRSRLVLVEGGSHFSPVRLRGQGDALFRFDQTLVGLDPVQVQTVLVRLTTEFLQTLDPGGSNALLLPPQRRLQQGVTTFILDAPRAGRWQGGLPRDP